MTMLAGNRGVWTRIGLLYWQAVSYPLLPMVSTFILFWFLLLLEPSLRPALVIYGMYIALDWSHAFGGSEVLYRLGLIRWFRGGLWWKLSAWYYPIRMEKLEDLPADKSYVFVCHPHGIIPVTMPVFGTDGISISKLLPNLRIQPVVLKLFFYMPFYREVLKMCDFISADASSLESSLSRGHSVAVAVGGAKEALETHPKTMRFVLRSRRGFLRCAVRCGASIVPVICFGENDLFRQVANPEGSWLRRVQDLLLSKLTFSLPLCIGHSIFFPYIPKNRPLHIVVGPPIATVADVQPSDQLLNELHEQYIVALTKLYDDHKHRFGYAKVPLEII